MVAQHKSIRRNAVAIRSVRHEEQNKRAKDAMHHAAYKLFGVEQRIVQSWRVQLWVLDAVLVRHVLLEDAQR